MLQKELLPRLQNMCNSFGFRDMNLLESCCCINNTAGSPAQPGSATDTVIMLSCKVHYNPGWGSLCGHPQLFTAAGTSSTDSCPSGFLAPFIRQYNLAQKQIFLTQIADEQFLISVPEKFLQNSRQPEGCLLNIDLEKIAKKNPEGIFEPIAAYGARCIYEVSNDFQERLRAQQFPWKQGRNIQIAKNLTPDIFFFSCTEGAVDRKSPFFSTLFTHLREIVTHRTPHLKAAEIHLEQEYNKTLVLMTADQETICSNRACIAGVEIDMSPFVGYDDKYFVPWKAYLERGDEQQSAKCSFNQDDLFVKLMQ